MGFSNITLKNRFLASEEWVACFQLFVLSIFLILIFNMFNIWQPEIFKTVTIIIQLNKVIYPMFYMLCISIRNKNVNPGIDSRTNYYSILTEVTS